MWVSVGIVLGCLCNVLRMTMTFGQLGVGNIWVVDVELNFLLAFVRIPPFSVLLLALYM